MKNLNIKKIKLILIQSTLILSVILFGVESLSAQATGMIRGRVLDSSSGDPMIGVTVVVMNAPGVFGITDINGQYVIGNAPVGPQTVRFSMMGYQTATTKVNVTAGGSARANVALGFKTAKTVVVRAKKISNTQASLLTKQKKAPAAQDAISAEQISKSPDSDAADAAKRVTGVTIVSNKIYIRGLSERYSSVLINNTMVPSTDPDKRFVPLDIFPVGILDSLVIVKGYTADRPAEFGGGVLEINPKNYPEDKLLKVSIGTGYHSLTTGKDFNIRKGSSLDWLGFGGAYRALPSDVRDFGREADQIPPNTVNDLNYTASQQETIGESFHNDYLPSKMTGLPPLSVSFEYGKTYEVSSTQKMGVMVSALLKESFKNYEKSVGYYNANGDKDLVYDQDVSTYSTTKGGLLSFAYKFNDANQVKVLSILSNKTKNEASVQTGYDDNTGDPMDFKRYSSEYSSELLSFNQLNGQHSLAENGRLLMNWSATYARAQKDTPDQRSVRLRKSPGVDEPYEFTNYTDLDIRYIENDDNIYDGQLSFTAPFNQWAGLKSKIKLGGGAYRRDRYSAQRRFRYNSLTGIPNGITDPADVFTDSNITADNNLVSDLYLEELTGVDDMYKGELTIASGYGEIDIPLIPKVRLITGARYEYSDMNIIVYDLNKSKEGVLDNEPLEPNNILPTANLVISPNDKSNIRLGYSRTISRPDFREALPFKYILFDSGTIAKGNDKLVQSNIDNFDLRYEYFPSSAELIAFSGFYKNIDSPVEVLEQLGSTKVITFANAAKAVNYGVELEARKNLKTFADALEIITVFTNFTYIISEIDLSEGVNLEGSNQKYTNEKRRLQGQSPYIVNAGMDLEIKQWNITNTILYNHIGERITRVGLVSGSMEYGDVIQENYGKLDYVLKWKPFEKGEFKFTAANLTDPAIKSTQENTKTTTGVKTKITRETIRYGRSFGISYSQKL